MSSQQPPVESRVSRIGDLDSRTRHYLIRIATDPKEMTDKQVDELWLDVVENGDENLTGSRKASSVIKMSIRRQLLADACKLQKIETVPQNRPTAAQTVPARKRTPARQKPVFSTN